MGGARGEGSGDAGAVDERRFIGDGGEGDRDVRGWTSHATPLDDAHEAFAALERSDGRSGRS